MQKPRLINANALMDYCQNQMDRKIDCNDIARFPTYPTECTDLIKSMEERIKELELEKNRLEDAVEGTVMMYEHLMKAKELLRDIYDIDCEGWDIRCRIAELLKEIE